MAEFAADTRFLEAAERHVGFAADMVIDPNRAGLDTLGDLLSDVLLPSPLPL